jgi:diguanylate cyclase (GGDEF)-like protein/putative nucleotidyltransferase with HDIG domain
MRFRDLPFSTRRVILATIGLALIVGVAVRGYWHPMAPWEFVVVSAVCAGLNLVQIHLTADKSRMSLGFAGLLGAMVLYGPANGAIIGFVEGAASNFVRHDPKTDRPRFARPDLVKLVFNAFNHSLSTSLGALTYVLAGGIIHKVDFQTSVIPAMLATTVFFLANTWSMAFLLATWKSQGLYQIWHENFLWTAPQFLASASSVVVALALYKYWNGAALVFLPIIYVVYYSYRLYMDKIRRDLEHITQLNELNNSVISSLATAIDAKDHYTNKHLSRVQTYALAMCDYLGVSLEDKEAVRCAALVHDIGKLGVPEQILTKPTKLTPEEHKRMQEHVEIGAAILRPVQFPWPVVEVVMGHHERWDGLGYPRGLKGEEIHIGARIIATADVFDALTSDRPYRKAMAYDEALEYLKRQSGTHFDPAVVNSLMAVREECERRIQAMSDGAPEALGQVNLPKKISDEVMRQIARANSEFFAMYDVSQSLRGPMRLEAVLGAVIEKVQRMVPFTTCAIYLDASETELQMNAVSGLYSELLMGMRIAKGEGLSGRVFTNLRPIVNGPATLDVGRKIPPSETVELNSSLVVPLRANGETFGTLSLYHSSYNIYPDDHARLVTLIADHAANSIDSARRHAQTQEVTTTDPITGLPNARALTNLLHERLEAAISSHEAFAVVLIDLDNFRQVNDTVGHAKGDEVLRTVAQAMQASVRTGDMLSRYAGDEFVLVVPKADHALLEQVCQRISEAVESLPRPAGVPLGASIGYAIYPDDALNARDLIAMADSRMYANKNLRRQR